MRLNKRIALYLLNELVVQVLCYLALKLLPSKCFVLLKYFLHYCFFIGVDIRDAWIFREFATRWCYGSFFDKFTLFPTLLI